MTIKDPANLMWFIHHRLSTLLGQESTEILSENKQKIMALEIDIAPRTISFIIKQDLGLSSDKKENALPLIKTLVVIIW